MHSIDTVGPFLACLIAAIITIYVGAAFLASLRDQRFDRTDSAERLKALGRAVDKANEQ